MWWLRVVRMAGLWAGAVLAAAAAGAANTTDTTVPLPAGTHAYLQGYAELVYRNYSDAWRDAQRLQQAVHRFVEQPAQRTPQTLKQLQSLWLASRLSYGQTEAFRFYEGPIDCAACAQGKAGPETHLNAWPLNESYIEAPLAAPATGLIQQLSVPITRDELLQRNARDDEADVTTGYHAIEFMLWGVDQNPHGPGQRSVHDFISRSDGDLAARRRDYLRVTTDLLVEQLGALVQAWAPQQDNFRRQWLAGSDEAALAGLLTGIATLSGFELGYERLATALDSGSQEDEQSCFSDSTLNDVRMNIRGIANVYFGHYHGTSSDATSEYLGPSLQALLRGSSEQLEQLLTEQLYKSQLLAEQLDTPFDQTLLTEAGSPQRQKVEALITSLQTQARLFKAAGRALGLRIVVAVDND